MLFEREFTGSNIMSSISMKYAYFENGLQIDAYILIYLSPNDIAISV